MEPDGDLKEEALEAPQKEPPQEPPKEIQEHLPVEGNKQGVRFKQFLQATGRLLLRQKTFLQTGLLKVIVAGKGLLLRLRKQAPEGDEADERNAKREERPGKSEERPGKRDDHSKAVPPAEPVAAPQPRSSAQSILLYVLVLLVGGLAGMTFSFVLLSAMVYNQAQKIDIQNDEIAQLERQHSKLMESEAKYRRENGEYRQRLSEIEALEAARKAEKEAALQESRAASSLAASGKAVVAKKTGNCNVDASNIGSNLARCVDEFNRK